MIVRFIAHTIGAAVIVCLALTQTVQAQQPSAAAAALATQLLELKDMIVFYKTALGKKMIEQEPKAGEASTKRAQIWIDKYAETVIAKMRAEMRKRGHNEF